MTSALDNLKKGLCMQCGHKGRHYVPPMMGDPGFFACESFCDDCRPATPSPETEQENTR